ncbi:MAG: helix-hairpin-helix domain-containing protein, partial [Candidatus Dormibacteria bacterium]
LPLFGARSARQLVAAVQSRRRPSLARLVYALGIVHVGERTAQLLAEHFGTLEALREAPAELVAEVAGVGAVVAAAVASFFASPGGQELVDQLLSAGVVAAVAERVEGPWSGKTFVLTGSLGRWSRGEAEQLIRGLGGVAASSVSRKTSAVVVGESPGSKLQAAERLGVTVLDEDQFAAWLEHPVGR